MRARNFVVCVMVLLFGASSIAAASASDERLLEAVKNKDSIAALSMLEHGNQLNLNVADTQGMTSLLWAAHWDDLDLVKCLISKGANVRAVNRFGSTALHEASTFGDVPMMEALLKAGADPNAVRGEGDTPLMTAARSGVPGAVALLLAHKAEVNAREESYGETPLMLAVNQNYSDVVKILIDHGADVNAVSKTFSSPRRTAVDATLPVNPDNGGLTPLFFAARQNAIESGRLLIAAGANLEAVEPSDRYTPLFIAISNDNFDFAKLLIEKGANLDGALGLVEIMRNGPAINDPGDAHMRSVRPAGSMELMKLLIAKGAPLDKEFTRRPLYDRNGDVPVNSTALSTAASYVDLEAMRFLLDSGAHPVPQRNGMTPLMLVVAKYNNFLANVTSTGSAEDSSVVEAVQMCLAAGMDVNAVDKLGQTALHFAAGNGFDKSVQILVDHGAKLDAKTDKGQTPLDWAQGKHPYRGLASAEDVAPHETTVALLQRLGAGSTVQKLSAKE